MAEQGLRSAWHERQITGHLDQLARVRDQATGAGERLRAVLEAYAIITRRSHGHEDHVLVAFMHRDKQVTHARHKLHGMIRDLVAEGAESGFFRGDVPPGELAVYCLHAVSAAGASPSEDAARRLVTVILDALTNRAH